MKQKIAILGAGSWGTAVAVHLAQAGHEVLLWGHNPTHIESIQQNHSNSRYLPDILFPENLQATPDLEMCINQSDHVIMSVPSHAFASVLNQLPKHLKKIAWLTKGIDPSQLILLSELVKHKYGDIPFAVISGPSFAKEVARGLPTAVVVAGNNEFYLDEMIKVLHHNNFRVYKSFDPVGVQICGAIKNVLAIACGISDGLSYGANAKAALITRGLAEMARLGSHMGASQDTFLGLAGVGDLVLTCTDDQSRNRRFGLLIGQGKTPEEAEHIIQQVVEGRHNANLISQLANQHQVDMPICHVINDILKGETSAHQAVEHLLSRPPTKE